MGRVREILGVLIRHGFGELVDRMGVRGWFVFRRRLKPGMGEVSKKAQRSFEERMRLVFEELGPIYIKLGQMLATRPDLIPMSLVLELRKLQDDVAHLPLHQIRQVILDDLGKPLEELFISFEQEPLAAASIAQVHRARLSDGTEVAVKVQRPNLDRIIAHDLQILRGFANLIHEKVPEARRYDLPGIVHEFGQALRVESDFNNERHNILRFNKLWADDESVRAPGVYAELSGRRVLTMELIDGAKVTDLEKMKSVGASPEIVSRKCIEVALKSIFDHGYFHADPHPGNFFVKADNEIVLIDFGMMGNLDRERLDELLSFLVSILTNDPDMMVRLFHELDIIGDDTNLRNLKREIKIIIDRYNNLSLGEIDLGAFIQQVFDVVVRHDVQLPADLLLVAKAMTVIQGIAQELDPDLDPLEAMRPFLIKTYVMHSLDPAHHAKSLARDFSELSMLLRRLPRELRVLLKKARKGELRVVTATEDLNEILERQDRRTNRALVLSGGLGGVLGGTLMHTSGMTGWGPNTMFVMGGLFLLWGWMGIVRSGGV